MRRAQEKALARFTIPMDVRVHEAGHAMARMFTHQLMDISVADSIDHIELGTPRGIRNDGAVILDNVTYGPFIGRRQTELFTARHPDAKSTMPSIGPVDFDAFRADGLSVRDWLFARCCIELGGGVAEAKFTSNPLDDVLAKWEVAGDLNDMHRNARFLRRKYISCSMANRAVSFLSKAFARPDIWEATLAMARSLKKGRNEGDALVKIATSKIIAGLPVPSFERLAQVVVRRDYNAPKTATYFLDDLSGWHWSDTSGGRGTKAPAKFLYAYAWCNDRVDGDLDHTCQHGDGPHHIKVCVTRSDNQTPWDEIGKEAAWSMRNEEKNAA